MQAPQSTSHTVEKIGGTSMSETATVLDNVLIAGREGEALYRRIFVVSAYAGITNLLLEHKKSGQAGVYALFSSAENEWTWGDAIDRVRAAMEEKNREIFAAHPSVRRVADSFVRERIEGVRSCLLDLHRLCSYGHFRLQEHLATVREMLSALGEAHSAHNTALLLQQHGVNAVFVDLTGWRDEHHIELDERIRIGLEDIDLASELPIVTGYAHCRSGLLEAYGRGYTEVTFSRVAVLTGAREAIIHKEFHLSSADPLIVTGNRVRTIGHSNYDVADQLSNLGVEAVHPRAAKGLRQAGIPLRVKNTFDPDNTGTHFSGGYVSSVPCVEIVTGLRGVVALEFFDQDMVGVKGWDAAILDALRRHNVRIVTKCSNANTITHYLETSLKGVKRAINDLEEKYPNASITIHKVSIVSAIGSDLAVPGLSATAIKALSDAGIEVLGIHQLIRNVDLQFVVNDDDFERCVRALHASLIETPRAAASSHAA